MCQAFIQPQVKKHIITFVPTAYNNICWYIPKQDRQVYKSSPPLTGSENKQNLIFKQDLVIRKSISHKLVGTSELNTTLVAEEKNAFFSADHNKTLTMVNKETFL